MELNSTRVSRFKYPSSKRGGKFSEMTEQKAKEH